MLLDARSIESPPPNGPAGGHLARMIEQLGIAEAVRPKLVIKEAIDGGAQLVAQGKVDVAMHSQRGSVSQGYYSGGVVAAGTAKLRGLWLGHSCLQR